MLGPSPRSITAAPPLRSNSIMRRTYARRRCRHDPARQSAIGVRRARRRGLLQHREPVADVAQGTRRRARGAAPPGCPVDDRHARLVQRRRAAAGARRRPVRRRRRGRRACPGQQLRAGDRRRNLPIRPGETIVVPQEEYPSAVYTWRTCARDTGARIVTVRRAAGQGWADAVVAAVDRGTAVVSVPQVHWTDGALVDLDAVADRCRQVGAHLVIDASQSLGAMPLDVTTLKPDAVVSVGYKWLLGPVGRAYLWLAEQHRDGRPLEENWIARAGADDFAALVDYRDDYQPGARRFDQGARTLLELTPVAIAALEQIHEWGVERIAAALRRVTADITDRLGAQGLVPSAPANGRGPHLLGVPVPPEARDGLLPALERAGWHAGLGGKSLRIAPHLHVTPDDVDRLVAAVAAALHGGS